MEELGRKSVDAFRQAPKIPVTVVLDNIRSMHNVGSVFRTADAFLLEGLMLCGYTPCPPHRDIQKTALGATETVYWQHFSTTREALQLLKAKGYTLWAVEQTSQSIPLQHVLGNGQEQPIAIVFGNEVSGVDADLLSSCDGCIEIPQLGMKHSLNISVAAGIVIWELVRNRLG